MPAQSLPGGNATGEFNPFQDLDLTRYGFGPERRLAPLNFPGLANLKPQPVTDPVSAAAQPAGPAGPDPASGEAAIGGLNPFDFAAGLKNEGQRGPGAGTFLNTVSGNKMAMAFLTMLFPGLGVTIKGADWLQNRGKEKTAAGRLPQTKPALTAQQQSDRATSVAAQQLAQQPLAQVQQTRPEVQAPVLPPDLYGGPDVQPDYGGIDFSGYDLSDASGFTPF